MNWQKLQRTLAKEFKRSPGKTCVLLALLPVAAYFILPLFWKKSGAAVTSTPVASITPSTAPPAGVQPPAVAWHELVRSMSADPRMRPAAPGGDRNPFQLPPSVAAAQLKSTETSQAEAEPEAVAQVETPELNPAELGLRLTATIVGPRVRMATINGKPYREKSSIVVSSERGGMQELESSGTAFTLLTVNRKHVVLERNGKLYQLELAR